MEAEEAVDQEAKEVRVAMAVDQEAKEVRVAMAAAWEVRAAAQSSMSHRSSRCTQRTCLPLHLQ